MKRTINFYQDSLKPQQEQLPFAMVIKTFAAVVVVLVLILGYQSWAQAERQSQLTELQQQQKTLMASITELNTQLEKQRDTQALQAQQAKLEANKKAREELIDYLSGKGEHASVNYSEFMNDLARYHNNNVWLTHMRLNTQQLALKGRTLSPNHIALWLQSLRQSPYFDGRNLSVLQFSKSDEVREFSVSSELKVKEQ